MAKIKPKTTADRLYKNVVAALPVDRQSDRMSLRLAKDMALLEELKHQCKADIEERGVTELFINGSQTFYRPNPNLAQIIKLVSEQRKIQQQLKLDPEAFELSDEDRRAEAELKVLLGGAR
jgi:hypothetical protein